MNLQQFNALKAGDTIENAYSRSRGAVIATTDSGVDVRWNGAELSFFYSCSQTAWLHWDLVPEKTK